MSEEKKEFEFTYGWCGNCACVFVRCPKCGNNSCNGGYGDIDGVECDVCPLAYQYQGMFWESEKERCSHFLKPSPTVTGWCSLLRKGIGDGTIEEVEDKGLIRCPCDKFSELTDSEHVENVFPEEKTPEQEESDRKKDALSREQEALYKSIFGKDYERN